MGEARAALVGGTMGGGIMGGGTMGAKGDLTTPDEYIDEYMVDVAARGGGGGSIDSSS